jgi:hypothetical protein
VAEELAARQLRDNRRAVEHDEITLLGPRIQRVNQTRDQLLARATLAEDEHRRIREVRHLDDLAQHGAPGRTLPDQIAPHERRVEEIVDGAPAVELGHDLGGDIRKVIPRDHVRRSRVEELPCRRIVERSPAGGDRQHPLGSAAARLAEEVPERGRDAIEEHDTRAAGVRVAPMKLDAAGRAERSDEVGPTGKLESFGELVPGLFRAHGQRHDHFGGRQVAM